MKLKSVIFFFLLAPAVLFLAQSCDKCDTSGTITLGEANQFLSVTYLVDSNGANYVDIWRPNNFSVQISDDPVNVGHFVALQEDLSDGMVGPFTYTTQPATAKLGDYHHYMYIVRKDTFGVDTFEVKFYPNVDECHEYWGLIEYYRNGELIPQCTGLETCALEIRE